MHICYRTIALLLFSVTIITTPVTAGTTQVAFFTGFSFFPDPITGMDELNDLLANAGIPDYTGMVFEWDDRTAARDWIQAQSDRSTLVLIGHSFGGNATLQLANNLLQPLGIDVDLTVQIDTVENFDGGWNTQLPANVDVGYNYYQIATGFLEPQGEFVVNGATNINAEALFDDTSIEHTSLDNDPRLHAVIEQHIFDNLNAENADFDSSTLVDGADFLIWQNNLGTLGTATLATGDANNDLNVDDVDLSIWEQQFATPAVAAVAVIPEPSSAAILLIALGVFLRRRFFISHRGH